jgi:hypothetical protein
VSITPSLRTRRRRRASGSTSSRPKNDKHEGHDAEAEDTLQIAADRPQNLDQPQHIDLLGEQLGGVEAAPLQQFGRVHIQALKPCSIGDHPLRDPSETPDDQPAATADCEQNDGGSDQDRDDLWQNHLQASLQRPDKRDDEQRKSYGYHHGTRRPEARQRQDRCAYRRGQAKRAVGSQDSAPC